MVPPPPALTSNHLPTGRSSENHIHTAGTMIQSQPINLVTTNGLVGRSTGAFERIESLRQDTVLSQSVRTINLNHSEHQAQDLSMHAHQQPQIQLQSTPKPFETEPVNNNTLLDFCNIILNYTNYPDAFHEEYNPVGQTIGNKGKVKGTRSKVVDTVLQRPPQKRKIGNATTTIKQKPGRKPKGAKLGPPPSLERPGAPPRLRAETISTPSQDENIRGKLDESRVNNSGRRRERKVSSPLNSVGESREGTHSSSSSTSSHVEERDSQQAQANLFYPDDNRDESWDEVTCFCGKPFAGRPMIECENCFVWHHMSCAKLRKTNVPKKFYCRDCKHMFPDFGQERQRRASGNHNINNNSLNAESMSHYHKSPVKHNKNGGLPASNGGSGTDVTTPLALTIPPVVQLLNDDQPKDSPKECTPSPQLSPQEETNFSQLPSGGKTGSSYSLSPMTMMSPTAAQLKARNQPYLNGTMENKPVSTLSKSSSTTATPEQSPKKSEEKTAKRRPTLNSASSGLYDDVVLQLKLTN